MSYGTNNRGGGYGGRSRSGSGGRKFGSKGKKEAVLNKVMLSRGDTPKRNWGRVVNEGQGGFLEPPGHPSHEYSVRSSFGDTFSMSLDSAAETDWLDPKTKAEAKKIMAGWKPKPIDDSETQKWIHEVMGYFKNCYVGKGDSWSVSDLEIKNLSPEETVKEQDKHAGVHFIRKYYPNFKLSEEDLKSARWGS